MPIAIAHAVAELSRMYPPAALEPPGKALTGLLIGTLLLAALFYLLERFSPSGPPSALSARAQEWTPSIGFSTSSSPETSHRRVHSRAHRSRRLTNAAARLARSPAALAEGRRSRIGR